MRRDLKYRLCRRSLFLALGIVAALSTIRQQARAQTPDEGGVTFDGGGQEVLQSIFIPFMPNAPFSLTVAAEWSRPMPNGGTFTTANSRPIMRDRAGRIYEERWLMSPKGSNIPSRMSWIQIADPVAHTFYQCNPRNKICDLTTLTDSVSARFDPARIKPGLLKAANGDVKGARTHEDLGEGSFAGMRIHEYKDTTTLNPGALGNDLPMSTTRQYRFCAELGLNLTSIVEAPQIGRQVFTVTELSSTDPDPSFFQPPRGYKVVDRRTEAGGSDATPSH